MSDIQDFFGGGAGALGIFPVIPPNKVRKRSRRNTYDLRGPIGDGDSVTLPSTEFGAMAWFDRDGATIFNLSALNFANTVTGWVSPPADVMWVHFWLDKADGSGGTTALLYILLGSVTDDDYYLVTLDSADTRTYINTMSSVRPVEAGTHGWASGHTLQRFGGDGVGNFTFTSAQHLLEFTPTGTVVYEAPSNISQLDGGWKINDSTYIDLVKIASNQSSSTLTHTQAEITMQINYQIDSSDPLHAWNRHTLEAPANMMGLPTFPSSSAATLVPLGWDGSLEFWTGSISPTYSYDVADFNAAMNQLMVNINLDAVPVYTG